MDPLTRGRLETEEKARVQIPVSALLCMRRVIVKCRGFRAWLKEQGLGPCSVENLSLDIYAQAFVGSNQNG